MADSGNLFVIAAPSGAGKTTLVKQLVDTTPNLTVSISHTTRAKRPLEQNEVNYHFIDKPTFERMIAHHDFLEHATVFDHFYGTSKSWVEKTLAQGLDVILEIDWQGQEQIKKLIPSAVSIFILPPSLDILKERLMKRAQDEPDMIKKRLADTKETLSHLHHFDYIIVNDDLTKALSELRAIILSERLRQAAQVKKYAKIIANLAGMDSK